VLLLGIALTFSRVAWAIAASAVLWFGLYHLCRPAYRKQAAKLFAVAGASGYLLLTVLSPFILPRAQISLAEPSVSERVQYGRVALAMLRAHPLGVGIGSQVLVAAREDRYRDAGIANVNRWQPIHNIYLLMAVDIGIAGAAAFLSWIGVVVWKGARGVRRGDDALVALTMLAALLLFGLFDHFFWTLWQGQLMLWTAVGLMLAGLGSRN
jgi:O-antigen ligase